MSSFLNKYNREQLHIMSNLVRYNNEIHNHSENVAEHSFYVAVYAMEICNILEVSDEIKLNCIQLALIHDIHEIELSDIPHNVKAKIPELSKICDEYEKKYNEEHFPNIKNEGISKLIVLIADCLSVYQYSLNEIQVGNSGRFIKIRNSSHDRIIKCLNKLDEESRTKLENEIFHSM